ncbi:MAG: flagellar export protein FliJ [Steroidobacteraceae bacterium]
MRQGKQLEMVQRIAGSEERRRAERVAAVQKRVKDCEVKLAELSAYQADYARDFARRAAGGLDGARVRHFQTFLARLGEAVRQQSEIVDRARAEREAELETWRQAARRAQMVGRVVEHRRQEARRESDRHEQRESDALSLARRHRD